MEDSQPYFDKYCYELPYKSHSREEIGTHITRKGWLKSFIVAVLKPGKDASSLANYLPIAWLVAFANG